MTNFDLGMLKQNIKLLLRNNGMTQQQLAEVLGMSQSNVSKALNEDEKKCFTVEQIYTIAEHFQVSIDSLFGRVNGEKLSGGQRTLAALIAALLNDGTAKSTNITAEDVVYKLRVTYPKQSRYRDSEVHSYNAIYFPNYWDPSNKSADDDERKRLSNEASQYGNESGNAPLNAFLQKYIDILRVYKDGQISKEAYEIVLKDYLGQLPET